MPTCQGGYGGAQCPAPSDKEQAALARPYCDACITGGGASSFVGTVEEPNACILVCNATAAADGTPTRAECPLGATCKPLTLDKDPCDNGVEWPAGAHPCQSGGGCGVCTYP